MGLILEGFKSGEIERRKNTEAIKFFSDIFFAEKYFQLKMGNIKLNYYFPISKTDQTRRHQNVRMWHVRGTRSWTLVIFRNPHKTLDVTTGFWGRA